MINEPCYKGTILQRNNRKMTIIPIENSMLKNLGATSQTCYIQIYVIMRCVIKGLHCIYSSELSDGVN